MKLGIFKWFSVDLGIDLGTCNTLVCVRGEGIVLNEPSVVAVRRGTKQIIAVGKEAREMLGRTPGAIQAIRPMRDGVIGDFDITEAMMAHYIGKIAGKRMFARPRVVIAVPGGVTEVEKRAVIDSALRAGAGRVFLVEEPLAAALGADLPVREAKASMVVDVGGGTTDVAVVSLGDIAQCESIKVAGDKFDESIIRYMREQYKLEVGGPSAESVKVKIGSAYPVAGEEETDMEVRGRDTVSGLPRKVVVSGEEIRECLRPSLEDICDCIKRVIDSCAPELHSDLLDSGICLAGGGGLLRGLPQLVEQKTGLQCHVAPEALFCVARGTAVFLENLEEMAPHMDSDMSSS